jgi:hypothetical protein
VASQQQPSVVPTGGMMASQVAIKAPETFWHDTFYYGVMQSISGPKKTAKSLCSIKVAADMSHVGNVIVSGREDSKAVLRLRLEAAGANLDNVFLPDNGYDIPTEIHKLRADIETLDARVVVLDTANKHVEVQMDKADHKAARALTPLSKMLEETEAGLIFIDHSLKNIPKSANPDFAISGGLLGSVRKAFLFGWDPTNADRRMLVNVADQYAEPQKAMAFTIETVDVFDPSTGLEIPVGAMHLDEKDIVLSDAQKINVVRVSNTDGQGTSASKRAEAAEFLTKLLAFGPRPVNTATVNGKTYDGVVQTVEEEGMSMMTVRRAAEAIGVIKSRHGSGKGSVPFWRLPDGHPALTPGAPTTL